MTISSQEALQRLIAGNQRYASDCPPQDHAHQIHRHRYVAEQNPFGIVLGCSDSRVPVEIVFDQTIGDLFVVRVAGYVLSDHVVGSIEYAVQTFGSCLILVLGHSHCGAVTAAVQAVTQHKAVTGRIASIVDSIRPAVERVRDEDAMLEAAIGAHVRAVTAELAADAAFAAPIASGKLAVVGAEYHLETGLVEILTKEFATP